jgi:hypothetical protein
MNEQRAFLRHTVATVAYRAGKALRDAPPGFAGFKPGKTSRTPLQILSHMGDLYDWALHLAKGEKSWNDATPKSWDEEADRFFRALERFDAFLAGSDPLGCDPGRLFQGPIADSLSHTGQLAMLRRMFGSPIRGENYFKAEIGEGRVGEKQLPPRGEFD